MKDDKEISREQWALIRLADKRAEEYFAQESAERAQRRKEILELLGLPASGGGPGAKFPDLLPEAEITAAIDEVFDMAAEV